MFNLHNVDFDFGLALQERFITTWFDAEKMHGSVIEQMCNGIDESFCVVAFITKQYIEKVGGSNDQDNCKLEFNYSHRKKGPSLMIPAVMESCVKNANAWSGSVGIVLGGHLYCDLSVDGQGIDLLTEMIVRTIKISVDGEDAPVVIAKPVAVAKPVAEPSSSSSARPPTLSANNKQLSELSGAEVESLLCALQLSKYVSCFRTNEVTGSMLQHCDELEEVKELGISITLHAKTLFQKVQEFKVSGVPIEMLSTAIPEVATAVVAHAPSNGGTTATVEVVHAQAVEAHPVASPVKEQAPKKEAAKKEAPEKKIKYPSSVTMSGCPLAHAGWNGVYTLQKNKTKHGKPVYRLPDHFLLFVPIIGADIYFNGSNWILHRDGDAADVGMHEGPEGDLPTGAWDDGIYVSA